MAADREGASVTLHINEWRGVEEGGAEQHFSLPEMKTTCLRQGPSVALDTLA